MVTLHQLSGFLFRNVFISVFTSEFFSKFRRCYFYNFLSPCPIW